MKDRPPRKPKGSTYSLKETLEYYEYFTEKASALLRNLSFVGIAIIWIFKLGENAPRIPSRLLLPALLFVVALAVDLLQYFVNGIVWGALYYRHTDLAEEDRFAVSWTVFLVDGLFLAKAGVVAAAYFYLFSFLYSNAVAR